jgi:hypothetical protein
MCLKTILSANVRFIARFPEFSRSRTCLDIVAMVDSLGIIACVLLFGRSCHSLN